MARRRFACVQSLRFSRRAFAVVDCRTARIALAILGIAAVTALAGCGTAPRPLSLEEAIWFHKAGGYQSPPPGHPLPLYDSYDAVDPYAPPSRRR
jgi:hypothetical protein